MKPAALALLGLLSLLPREASTIEVYGNCLQILCEKLEGKCVERSDLELKITLDDNCKRLEYCSINNEWDGVCKLKNAYLDPLRLYPGDPCSPGKYDSTCFYGLQKCNWDNKCLGSRLDG